MRHGTQICEGADFQTGHYCLSEARWHTKVFLDNAARRTLDFYLCSTCHALAEYDWAQKKVPRKTEYREQGFETVRGHETATHRKARLFARECKTEQLPLFQAA